MSSGAHGHVCYTRSLVCCSERHTIVCTGHGLYKNGRGLYTVLDMDFTLTPPIYSCTLLHVTRWCSLLARTTPTPSLHAPEKSSIRPEHDQYLTVRAHPFRGAHVHPRGSAIRHQFSIHVHLATSAGPYPPSALQAGYHPPPHCRPPRQTPALP